MPYTKSYIAFSLFRNLFHVLPSTSARDLIRCRDSLGKYIINIDIIEFLECKYARHGHEPFVWSTYFQLKLLNHFLIPETILLLPPAAVTVSETQQLVVISQ